MPSCGMLQAKSINQKHDLYLFVVILVIVRLAFNKFLILSHKKKQHTSKLQLNIMEYI